jgi:hypothetical protein
MVNRQPLKARMLPWAWLYVEGSKGTSQSQSLASTRQQHTHQPGHEKHIIIPSEWTHFALQKIHD